MISVCMTAWRRRPTRVERSIINISLRRGGRRLTATARKFNNYKGDGVFSRHNSSHGASKALRHELTNAERSAQLERRLRDDQEAYWRAYQILNHIVEQ